MLPLIDLKKQYAEIENRVKAAVIEVMDSGQYIMGPEVHRIEKRLANYVGARYCVSCASGTDALFMALLAKGVGTGSLVFTTPFTFFATAEAIALTGAIPVFVDVDPRTFNLDPEKLILAIEACRRKDTTIYPVPKPVLDQELRLDGIMTVDLFGLPADHDLINAIAQNYGMFVIEDAAQSFGSEYRGRKGGNLADIGCTSFFPAKPLGAYGDGGAVFCNDPEIKDMLESIRVHGQGASKYENVRLGVNGRLDSIQAAVLDVKLDIFDSELMARQRVAAAYRIALETVDNLVTPFTPEGYTSAWAQYTILASGPVERNAAIAVLAEKEIGHAIYYPIPLHQQRAFSFLEYRADDFPVAMDLSSRVFSVPMHPYLTQVDIDQVAVALKAR